MTVKQWIAKKEAEISALQDTRWQWLMGQRRAGVKREKRQNSGDPKISAVIDKGYLNTLRCILKCAKQKGGGQTRN